MEDKKYCYKYPHPAVTTNCIIFGFDGIDLNVLLVERGIEPFKGKLAFPGGFLNPTETAEEGAARELFEETGLKNVHIEQFHTFSSPDRDPRERVITIAFIALVKIQEVKGGDDVSDAKWFHINKMPKLAFDHESIFKMALERLKERIYFYPIGFELLPEKFTMKELQTLYETILNVKFDRRNFSKKMLKLDLLTKLNETKYPTPKKEAALFSFNLEKYNELKNKGCRFEF